MATPRSESGQCSKTWTRFVLDDIDHVVSVCYGTPKEHPVHAPPDAISAGSSWPAVPVERGGRRRHSGWGSDRVQPTAGFPPAPVERGQIRINRTVQYEGVLPSTTLPDGPVSATLWTGIGQPVDRWGLLGKSVADRWTRRRHLEESRPAPGVHPCLYVTPLPVVGYSHSTFPWGQAHRQLPHSRQFS